MSEAEIVGDGAPVEDQPCASCGQALATGSAFCENCGAKVVETGGASPAVGTSAVQVIDDEVPISAPTAITPPVATVAPQTTTCTECGGSVGAEGYCDQCGSKAASERDHFRERPASWVAGVCDRGIRHTRNEDAMALWAQEGPVRRAVLVVCDGVSSSKDSDVASLAGARAARAVLQAPLPKGLGVPESVEAAATKVFVAAAAAANTAVIAHTDPASPSPASCTFVAASVDLLGPVATAALTPAAAGEVAGQLTDGAASDEVEGADHGSRAQLRYAVIGDSRAYWFPDVGQPVQLTTDDSMAQMLIASGMGRERAEASPQAHAITKWLGKDSPDIVPVVGALEVTGPGWLMVCSDGLWNYASAAEDLATQLAVAVTATRWETTEAGPSAEAGVPGEGGSSADANPSAEAGASVESGSAAEAVPSMEGGRPQSPETPSADPEAVALHLVEFAKGRGGHDNITVALARLDGS